MNIWEIKWEQREDCMNAAMVSIKLGDWNETRSMASSALAVKGIDDAQRAKALYRRGVAHLKSKDEDDALADLEAAHKILPNDAAIANELNGVKSAAKARREKEKAAYKKFFD